MAPWLSGLCEEIRLYEGLGCVGDGFYVGIGLCGEIRLYEGLGCVGDGVLCRDWVVWGDKVIWGTGLCGEMGFYVGTGLCGEIRLYEGLGCGKMGFYVRTGLCEEIRLYEGLGCVGRWAVICRDNMCTNLRLRFVSLDNSLALLFLYWDASLLTSQSLSSCFCSRILYLSLSHHQGKPKQNVVPHCTDPYTSEQFPQTFQFETLNFSLAGDPIM